MVCQKPPPCDGRGLGEGGEVWGGTLPRKAFATPTPALPHPGGGGEARVYESKYIGPESELKNNRFVGI
jgi:hypothetical protein